MTTPLTPMRRFPLFRSAKGPRFAAPTSFCGISHPFKRFVFLYFFVRVCLQIVYFRPVKTYILVQQLTLRDLCNRARLPATAGQIHGYQHRECDRTTPTSQ